MAEPLVADAVDLSTPFAGTFLLEDGEALAHAIESGDWVEGGLAAFSGALDAVATISDPLGSLIAAGLGWLIEHVEPLRGWFNDLTGDAGEVAGFARTWSNIATRMHDSGDLYTRRLTDLEDMSGATIDAYLAYAADTAKHLHAAGDWAGAVSTGLQLASTLVKAVHDLVRDALSQLVGMIISLATEAVATAGFALPLIIEQVATRVSALATRVGTSITRLLTSFKSFTALFEALQELLRRGKTLFDRMPPGKAGDGAGPRSSVGSPTPSRPNLPIPNPRAGSAPGVHVSGDRLILDGRDVMSSDEWLNIRSESVHNAEAQSSLLGRYDDGGATSYLAKAQDGGYRYFDLGSKWEDIEARWGLGDAEMFDLFNRPFLDDAISRGQTIHFSHDPTLFPNTALDAELRHLRANGYRFDDATFTARPGRQK